MLKMIDIERLFSCFEEENPLKETIDLTNERRGRKRLNTDESHDTNILNNFNNNERKKAKKYISYSSKVKYTELLKTSHCVHEVAYPQSQDFPKLVYVETMAKEYKFPLDEFQKLAIGCLDSHQSVLVSAHTSAGKTVVAEYAIALSLKKKQRVIYTTPIKALSNQKYRQLLEEFKDVGLMTGDTTINPSASCLIMTTEILRSMLFKGSEITKEVGWVIFDEIHYMRDLARGVIWEDPQRIFYQTPKHCNPYLLWFDQKIGLKVNFIKCTYIDFVNQLLEKIFIFPLLYNCISLRLAETIVMLSDNVRYVFLSATIPNAREFVEWIAELHTQPCHAIYTEKRPTPLQHFLFPVASDGMHLIKDENDEFNATNFSKAMSTFKNSSDNNSKTMIKDNVFNVVNVMINRNLAPLIIFSFSKMECETYARHMAQLNLNTEAESKLVKEVYQNAINLLSDEDKQIQQVKQILPLLQRGIAYHHSGLLPIIKETVEILFGEGLIKTLFATETFAMGLNMPAKTVIFTSIKKFDGQDDRLITSGEYIQMSGRAGRRGIDEKGTVVLMINEHYQSDIIQNITSGKPDPLNSAFHLTYNMILNLLRQEDINPEYMIERSFFMFQTKCRMRELDRLLGEKQRTYDKFRHIPNVKLRTTINLHKTVNTLTKLNKEMNTYIMTSKYVSPFIHEGRLVKIIYQDQSLDWGVIIKGEIIQWETRRKLKSYSVLIPIKCETEEDYKTKYNFAKIIYVSKSHRLIQIPLKISQLYQISSIVLKIPHFRWEAQQHILNKIAEIKTEYSICMPLLHPINDMNVQSSHVKRILDEMKILEKRLTFESEKLTESQLNRILNTNSSSEKQINEIIHLQAERSKLESFFNIEELQQRKNVLKKIDYCSETDVINIKGRVACELTSANEILLTEMIFSGLFNDFKAEKCVALLSCFVNDDKVTNPPQIDLDMKKFLLSVEAFQAKINKISSDEKLTICKEKDDKILNGALINVLLSWCRGASFIDVCKQTTIREGSLVRYFRRLAELMEEMCKSARNVGSTDLENKFSEGIRLLKRGIPFTGSLYL